MRSISISVLLLLLWPALQAGDTIRNNTVLPFWDYLELVDEIDCSQEGNDFHTNGSTSVSTILGRECRVLEPADQSKYFYYRIGKGKNLEAGKAYFLEIEYPDDVGRNFVVQNRGGEYVRGIQTGRTLGDSYDPPYVNSNPESISLPHTQEYKSWKTLFWLHDHYAGLELPRDKGNRTESPDDGFLVIICQFDVKNNPLSEGAAVSAIRLYEAPDFEILKTDINFPPDELPRRHLFFREEMADGAVNDNPPALNNPIDYYEQEVKLMKFLGMNTFSKDLLEFGHNQGWDPEEYGYNWVYTPAFKDRWEKIITMLEDYDLDVMPYYEYAGSIGGVGLGPQQRAHPLNDDLPDYDYTHISWTEGVNADLTDPDTYEDLKKIFDKTILKFKDRVNFLGAWLRPRSSELPISFADAALERFRVEANDSVAVTRAELASNQALYDKYHAWWFGKRKEFLTEMRSYLIENGVNDSAVVLYTTDHSESGRRHGDWFFLNNILGDDNTGFPPGYLVYDLDKYIENNWHLKAQLMPPTTWGDWEWQHASPEPDPDNYSDEEGIMMTYTFNKAYTVGSPTAFDRFRTKSGLAIVRHYCLNENAMDDMGYFVADIEWHGPYTMLAEARAVAYGSPRYIGYLAGSAFNKGSVEYVKEFNSNFLALPALTGSILSGASSDPEVVVREISTEGHGTYLAIVNTGLHEKKGVRISLPFVADVTAASTNEVIRDNVSEIILDLYPAQLKSLLLHEATGKKTQNISIDSIPFLSITSEYYKLKAVSSSGLPLEWELISGTASLSNDSLVFNEPGWLKLRVTQSGNEEYYSASKSISVRIFPERTHQSFTFSAFEEKFTNDPPFKIDVTAGSGLPVLTEVLSGPASISGDSIALSGDTGQVEIQFYQEGNQRFFPADSIFSFNVIQPEKSEQFFQFDSFEKKYSNDPPFKIEISASSGLPVTTQILMGPADLLQDSIVLSGDTGQVVVQFTQVGNELFLPLDSLFSFTVVDTLTSVGGLETIPEIFVYPNPIKNQLNIHCSSYSQVSIYSALGRNLLETELVETQNIDVSALPAGLYFLKILNQGREFNFKLIKE